VFLYFDFYDTTIDEMQKPRESRCVTYVLPVVVYILLVNYFRSCFVYKLHLLRLRGVRSHIDTDTCEDCNSGAAPFVIWSFNLQVKTWSQLPKCLVYECNCRQWVKS